MVLTTRKSMEFILVAGIPMSVGVYYFSEQIIRLFFGLEQYGASIPVLQIFSVGLLLVYVDMILATVIVAADKQRQWSVVAFIAVFLNISLNYFMIPYSQSRMGNGGIGAAVATIITEFFVMMSAIMLLPRAAYDGSDVRVPLKGFAGGVVMAVSIWCMKQAGAFWLIQAVVGLGAYAGVLILTKVLDPDELEFMRSIVTFRNLKRTFVPGGGTNA